MLETLGQYRILDQVGAGRMGELYRARDTRLGRTVAIRVLAAHLVSDPDRRERVLGRARTAAALSHPNIAALYEIGDDAGRLFLVHEFAAGEPLRRIIGGQPLNPRRAIDLASQIADALADAHAEDLACGALTAGNIVVTPKGQLKVLDFGLAAATSGASGEQAGGEPGDYRHDIFSLGALLFEMLTGKPFSGTAQGVVPEELGPIVMKALGTGGDGRYESAATLAAELRAVAAVLDVRAKYADSSAVVVRPARRSWFRKR